MPSRVFATASLVHFKRQSFSFCESSGLGLVHMAESTLGRDELWAGGVDSSALSGRLPRGVGGFAQTPVTAPVAMPSLPYKSPGGNSRPFHGTVLTFCGVGGRKVDMNNREFKACRYFFWVKNWILIEIFQDVEHICKIQGKSKHPHSVFFLQNHTLRETWSLGTPCTEGWTLPMCSDP